MGFPMEPFRMGDTAECGTHIRRKTQGWGGVPNGLRPRNTKVKPLPVSEAKTLSPESTAISKAENVRVE